MPVEDEMNMAPLSPSSTAMNTQQEPVWVLLGSKKGDNSQMLALAQALSQSLGLSFRAIQLRFNVLHWLPPALLGRSLASVVNRDALRDQALPRLVISSGLRSVPAARWLQARSQGASRLVHIGRPWGPPHWFDLIVTTPQYAVPAGGNVHHNLLPLLADELKPAEISPLLRSSLGRLPRPWTVVMLGGHSRPLRFTPEAARALAESFDKDEGSLLVLGSPRTPPACIEAMRSAFDRPHLIFPFGRGENPYAFLRQEADRFVVTGDSVQMAAELLLCGKPLRVFPLPEVPDLLVRVSRAWRDAAGRLSWLRPAFEWSARQGLLFSLRDIGLFHRQLDALGVYAQPDLARQLRVTETAATVYRVAKLLHAKGARG